LYRLAVVSVGRDSIAALGLAQRLEQGFRRWARLVSNQRPLACEASAERSPAAIGGEQRRLSPASEPESGLAGDRESPLMIAGMFGDRSEH
jgi:hypothetical protein